MLAFIARIAEIECAPEEADLRRNAIKFGVVSKEDAITAKHDAPPCIDDFRIVDAWGSVLNEGDGIRDFLRMGVDLEVDAKSMKSGKKLVVECGY